jgi:hypothetical protein
MSDEIEVPDGIRHYSELELRMCENFAKSYINCYDAELAAIGCGYSESKASLIGERLLRDPMTLRFIRQMECGAKLNPLNDEFSEDSKLSEQEQWQRKIRARLLREASDRGRGSSHAARVTALGILARSHGMLNEGFQIGKKEDDGQDEDVGGVLIVDSVKSEEEWEAKAIEHSKVLKDK